MKSWLPLTILVSLCLQLLRSAPTAVPTATPTYSTAPSFDPTLRPTRIPTYTVTDAPSTVKPTREPTTLQPTKQPITATPTMMPSPYPSSLPTNSQRPTPQPTSYPTSRPSCQPSMQPSGQPTGVPSGQPSTQPSTRPTMPTGQPTSVPSQYFSPTSEPTSEPSISRSPTRPTVTPTFTVTHVPTVRPSRIPTQVPTALPTAPTFAPTTKSPSAYPTVRPTRIPTASPTLPTSQPTSQPSLQPQRVPTSHPTSQPTSSPSSQPTFQPTQAPSHSKYPSKQPTSQPTGYPTQQPTTHPSSEPTNTVHPSERPTMQPSSRPSSQPSSQPTCEPTAQPTMMPTGPTPVPTGEPSCQPTSHPSGLPSSQPSTAPSCQPTSQPSMMPSQPSSRPTSRPTPKPTTSQPTPTAGPTVSSYPTSQPTNQPTGVPSSQPSLRPTAAPSLSWKPTVRPSSRPTSRPTAYPTNPSGIKTARPTNLVDALDLVGTVELQPKLTRPCQAIALHFEFVLERNLSAGSVLLFEVPGITSGPCVTPESGLNLKELLISSSSELGVKGVFKEGNWEKGFADSRLVLTLTDNFVSVRAPVLFIHIDRLNGLRAGCLLATNNTWAVYATPASLSTGLAGHVSVREAFASNTHFSRSICQSFYSAISFEQAYPQFPTGINLTFHFPVPLAGDSFPTKMTIRLPFFTNTLASSMTSSAIHPQSSNLQWQYFSIGNTKSLLNVSSSTKFRWTGQVVASPIGDIPLGSDFTTRMRKTFDLTITLYASGYMSTDDAAEPFWIYIPPENRLTPVCGMQANSSLLSYEVLSPYFRVNSTTFDVVGAIGSGCDSLNKCNGQGVCDYCTQTCICHDGFGSTSDKEFLQLGVNMPTDCSARTCPSGPAVYVQPTYVEGRANTTSYADPHRLIECSNNGLCDRQTGRCQCRPGFSGSACERATCPQQCSQRGRCLNLQRLGSDLAALPLSFSQTRYDDRKLYGMMKASATWDFNRGAVCLCDSSWSVGLLSGQTQLAEYFGPACEYRRCPSGDDPDTLEDETDCEGKNQSVGGIDVGKAGNKCHIDCSNRGLCDYATGLCDCFDGYRGINCGMKI